MPILALDQGTSSSRAIIFDEGGKVLAIAQKEFPQYYPEPGWVEHNPYDLWATQSATAIEAMAHAHLQPRDIQALGITNQRESTLIWERKTLRPIHPVIVWQDRRTAPLTDSLKNQGLEPLFREKTGLVLDPYFSGTKIKWILDNVPGARTCAERGELAFGTVDSWLLAQLTQGGLHATDPSNASRTLLFNIHTRQWDDELLKILDIPHSLLPEVRASSGYFADAMGPLANIPIHGVAGDQQAALFGQACFSPGMAKNTYGTGCFLLLNTGEKAVPSQKGLLSTIAWQIEDKVEYALEGSVFIGGAIIQWLRDGLGLFPYAKDSEALAASVNSSEGVVFVPAFAGLGAPYWDPYARGTLIGLTRATTKAHITRAALEAIALQSADLLAAMNADAGVPLKELRVDGGASANQLLMQIQADILNTAVLRPQVTETTALGAAYLAGLSAKIWKSKEEIAEQWSAERQFLPATDLAYTQVLLANWKKAVSRSRAWAEE